ncbi:MAG: transposase [Bacteroidota bacterium]
MENTKSILKPDYTYHIYNRANGNDVLFRKDENYRFFLKKYDFYITPIADTFCYCLMPNHFHFLVRIKAENKLTCFLKDSRSIALKAPKDLTGFQNLSGLISKQFSNFFNAYTKAINKQQNRNGNLFSRPFKRKQVDDETYLKKLVHYIHYNPIEAGLTVKPEDWRYTSYLSLLSNRPTKLGRTEVIDWFNDKQNFIYCHQKPPSLTGIEAGMF